MAEKPKGGEIELDMSPAESAAQLAKARARIAELEQAAIPSASSAFSAATEIHAGKNDDGEDLWYYVIDIPPSGGIELKINGHSFYHQQQYKINTNTLRTLKEMAHRAKLHDEQIHGSNENFYRRPQERTLRGGR